MSNMSDEIYNEIIGDLENDLSLEKYRELREKGSLDEVYELQTRVMVRLNQILGKLDRKLQEEAWRLIHSLRNLEITRCNIEDKDPIRNLMRLRKNLEK